MDDQQLVEVLGALAEPSRLRILRALQQRALRCQDPGDCDFTPRCCTVSELSDVLGVSVPTASHHLKELRRAGLVDMTRRGRFVEVSLHPQTLHALAAAFADFAEDDAPYPEAPHA